MWYYGGANNVRTRFSAQYSELTLPARKPLNTRLVTIKYLDDESDADKNQLCFVPFHSSLSTLANRDMVEGWKSYLDGYICFWVDVEGDGEL
jgi:hypothetical protein